MRATIHLLAWAFVMLALVYVAVGPHGALPANPLTTLGVGLIGLGLVVEARRRSSPLALPRMSLRALPGIRLLRSRRGPTASPPSDSLS